MRRSVGVTPKTLLQRRGALSLSNFCSGEDMTFTSSTGTRPSGDLKLEKYVLDFIPDCIQHVQEHSGQDDMTLVGYCMGGLNPDGPLKNLPFGCRPLLI